MLLAAAITVRAILANVCLRIWLRRWLRRPNVPEPQTDDQNEKDDSHPTPFTHVGLSRARLAGEAASLMTS
jgi:hypothetical protein